MFGARAGLVLCWFALVSGCAPPANPPDPEQLQSFEAGAIFRDRVPVIVHAFPIHKTTPRSVRIVTKTRSYWCAESTPRLQIARSAILH